MLRGVTVDTAPRTALVLSGGGARGAFDAGVALALADVDLTPQVVSGTSAGAITGAALASGVPADRVVDLWTSLQTRDVMRFRRDVHRLLRPWVLLRDPRLLLGAGRGTTSDTLLDLLGWTWFLDLAPMRRRLVRELGGERLPLRDDVTLTLSAIEVDSGRLVRFANRPVPDPDRDRTDTIVTELTVDHVMASAAIPGLFRPTRIDGVTYWDGGLTSNTPLVGALEHEPDRVIVVGAAAAVSTSRPAPRSIGDVVALAIGHLVRDALERDVDIARTVNELVEHAPAGTAHRAVEMVTVVPETPIEGLGDLLDFEPAVARDLIEAGRRLTAEQLARTDWIER